VPTVADGGIDEEKLDEQAREIGEIPDVEAGETKEATFDLTPGKYVMFCNLPGHYAQGMYGSITVTKQRLSTPDEADHDRGLGFASGGYAPNPGSARSRERPSERSRLTLVNGRGDHGLRLPSLEVPIPAG
jgi:hypothetical protein